MAPIHRASYRGDLAEVKRLVEEEGVNPEEPDPLQGNLVPLHHAAEKGRDKVVTYLLETCGVDVNLVDDDNWTALHDASHENHLSCLRLLLQHDADPNITTTTGGSTPLMLAASFGSPAAMTLLLQDGRCNLEIKRTDTGHTAILLAAAQKKWDCVELLLSYHASPVATRNNGWSLQDYATRRQAPPHTLRLIESSIFEEERPRLLHRARRINEARQSPATDGPAFLRQRADNNLPLPHVELAPALPTAGAGAGNEAEQEEERVVRRAVVQYVVGMKEDGSVGGGMLKEHVVELMDMMLPVWDKERLEEGEEEEEQEEISCVVS